MPNILRARAAWYSLELSNVNWLGPTVCCSAALNVESLKNWMVARLISGAFQALNPSLAVLASLVCVPDEWGQRCWSGRVLCLGHMECRGCWKKKTGA